MKKLIIAGLLLATAQASAEWTVFQENSRGDLFMMDRTTIQRSGQTVKVWTMVSFTKPQALAGGYGRSIKIQDEYNCATREKRVLHMINYTEIDGRGKAFNSINRVTAWTPVAPDTIANDTLRLACRS